MLLPRYVVSPNGETSATLVSALRGLAGQENLAGGANAITLSYGSSDESWGDAKLGV
ncbi:MAG: hypothetical protein ABI411_18925 [Tahibacter sp.]